jgi:hypothetical protein
MRVPDLHPVPALPAPVHTTQALRDNPLQAQLAIVREEASRASLIVTRITDKSVTVIYGQLDRRFLGEIMTSIRTAVFLTNEIVLAETIEQISASLIEIRMAKVWRKK